MCHVCVWASVAYYRHNYVTQNPYYAFLLIILVLMFLEDMWHVYITTSCYAYLFDPMLFLYQTSVSRWLRYSLPFWQEETCMYFINLGFAISSWNVFAAFKSYLLNKTQPFHSSSTVVIKSPSLYTDHQKNPRLFVL